MLIIIPAIINILVKSGRIGNDVFQTTWVVNTLIVWFFIAVFYMNTTTETLSFMAKIISINLVTVLVIIQFVGYFLLQDRDNAYDISRSQQLYRVIHDDSFRPGDLKYLVYYDHQQQKSKFIIKDMDVNIYTELERVNFNKTIKRDTKIDKNYKSYIFNDKKSGALYECGFSYTIYRQFIHEASLKLVFILIAVLIIELVGFRIFFAGALVKPLQSLMKGLRKVREGSLDIKINIKSGDEIGFLSERFNSMVKTIKDHTNNLELKVNERTTELQSAMNMLTEANQQLVRTKDALWGEMQLARKIQTILLPKDPVINGYDVSVYMEPANDIGGDYYDIINVSGADWIIIGDVSGHGVPAGLIMMMAQTSIRTVLEQNPGITPKELLKIINIILLQNIKQLGEDKYMTITALACLQDGKFIFSGFHQDIILFRCSTLDIEKIETQGNWVGILEDNDGLFLNDEFIINPGDIMMLFTDGITEAWRTEQDKDGAAIQKEMYGFNRLSELFFELGKQNLPPSGIIDGLLKDFENYKQEDDITLVILKRV